MSSPEITERRHPNNVEPPVDQEQMPQRFIQLGSAEQSPMRVWRDMNVATSRSWLRTL